MKFRHLFLLLAFCFNTSWADFSKMVAVTHPGWPSTAHYLPSGVPYIIELTGEWPNDCHPGEQKPVITEYTGDFALIEFETIVEHVTCNDVVTPFRVLIDVSDVFGRYDAAFGEIDITVRFGESEYTDTLLLACSVCSPPPLPGDPTNPEAGIYHSDGLETQGLLLARQNQRMGAFPLVYDELGSSEWLIGAGGITEDVFFAELLESTGGQCLGCLPPDEPPQIGVVGKISMLMDSEGVVQVKINDGLFKTYEPSVFGYGSIPVGGNPRTSVPNLSGRWAFSDSDIGINPNGSVSPTEVLPLVFDVVLEDVVFNLPPIVLEPPMPPGDATFSIRNLEGEAIVGMKCTNFDYDPAQRADEVEISCIIAELGFEGEIEQDGPLFKVEFLSPERMLITYSGLISGVGKRSDGTAVRID